MLGRFIGFLAGAAFAALAVLIYDPSMLSPSAPAVGLGPFEAFRPAAIAAAALLGLSGFLAMVQPRPKAKVRTEPLNMADEPQAEPEPREFSMGGGSSPSAAPLW